MYIYTHHFYLRSTIKMHEWGCGGKKRNYFTPNSTTVLFHSHALFLCSQPSPIQCWDFKEIWPPKAMYLVFLLFFPTGNMNLHTSSEPNQIWNCAQDSDFLNWPAITVTLPTVTLPVIYTAATIFNKHLAILHLKKWGLCFYWTRETPLDEKRRDSTSQPFDNELKEIKNGSTYEDGLKLDEVGNSV